MRFEILVRKKSFVMRFESHSVVTDVTLPKFPLPTSFPNNTLHTFSGPLLAHQQISLYNEGGYVAPPTLPFTRICPQFVLVRVSYSTSLILVYVSFFPAIPRSHYFVTCVYHPTTTKIPSADASQRKIEGMGRLLGVCLGPC